MTLFPKLKRQRQVNLQVQGQRNPVWEREMRGREGLVATNPGDLSLISGTPASCNLTFPGTLPRYACIDTHTHTHTQWKRIWISSYFMAKSQTVSAKASVPLNQHVEHQSLNLFCAPQLLLKRITRCFSSWVIAHWMPGARGPSPCSVPQPGVLRKTEAPLPEKDRFIRRWWKAI